MALEEAIADVPLEQGVVAAVPPGGIDGDQMHARQTGRGRPSIREQDGRAFHVPRHEPLVRQGGPGVPLDEIQHPPGLAGLIHHGCAGEQHHHRVLGHAHAVPELADVLGLDLVQWWPRMQDVVRLVADDDGAVEQGGQAVGVLGPAASVLVVGVEHRGPFLADGLAPRMAVRERSQRGGKAADVRQILTVLASIGPAAHVVPVLEGLLHRDQIRHLGLLIPLHGGPMQAVAVLSGGLVVARRCLREHIPQRARQPQSVLIVRLRQLPVEVVHRLLGREDEDLGARIREVAVQHAHHAQRLARPHLPHHQQAVDRRHGMHQPRQHPLVPHVLSRTVAPVGTL